MKISSFFVGSLFMVSLFSCSENQEKLSKREMSIQGRNAYNLERLMDPATGKIPDNIRMKELAFASTLPKSYSKSSRTSSQIFEPIGPRNVGGRTRAVSFDKDSANVVLAGGVSGGMWRSRDLGQSWKRATNFEDQSAVSCVIQDVRPGKSNIFYYGSGESSGNSASKSFSANYYGSGMYKSTDHGKTWTLLTSTATSPEARNQWSYIFNIALDQSNTAQDVILAATTNGIRRSDDGGVTWTLVLGGSSSADYTNVVSTTNGVFYAHISTGGTQSGFWRSTDGINWSNISPTNLPSHDRVLMAVAPSNQNTVYFYAVTTGSGLSDVSFWKYTYLNANGAGSNGIWANRSANLPPARGYSLNTQGSYCMSLIVKPDDEDVVYLGGTNLFRTTDGFSSSTAIRQIGGYNADGYSNFDFYNDNQHPDQQSLAFRPQFPDHLLAGTDGGLHFSTNPLDSKVIWQNFNNGYQTTQFYGIAIDHLTENEIVCSGFQDNGSWQTTSADTNAIWTSTMGGDGCFCAKEQGTDVYYFSSQYGNIYREKVSATGNVSSRRSARPNGVTTGYSFVHPFILNPADNNQMYLPISNSLWRNDDLAGLDFGQRNWTQITTLPTNSSITAIGASKNVNGVVYVGTRSRSIFKVVDDGTATATVTDISTGITSGTYTSHIEVDPNNSDRVLVVYSNYKVISMWFTEDGGTTWSNVEGNLVGNSSPGTPAKFAHLSDGPSFRWAKFVKTVDGEAILLGTSIGLFATQQLDGANTEWIQQASDVIGNVVIEQLEYRESDGFFVVGTHGAGAYKTYFENNYDITSVNDVVTDKLKINIYPNPVVSQLSIDFSLSQSETVTLDVLNNRGQIIQTKNSNGVTGSNIAQMDLSTLANGAYYLSIRSSEGQFTKSFVKQ
tara:strand:- start:125737 stop:128424 length:2688 start_codon:yes stop_codon:yes gene_type:complete